METELANLRASKTGDGVHNLLFRIAKGMAPFRDDASIAQALRDATAGCGRHVPDAEIAKAIRNSKARAWQPPIGGSSISNPIPSAPAPAKWPKVNQEQREAVIRGAGPNFELCDLWELSPVRMDPAASEVIIDALFPGNPLLCVGRASNAFSTRPREDWRGALSRHQFIVPSAMSRVTGTTQDGKESERCLDNTGPRCYAVVEFDIGTVDEQAAILWHLRFQHRFPLVLAVHSGGKSLHGWFNVRGLREQSCEAFYRFCVQLGADPATSSRCQLVRMPDGTRDSGQLQAVHYFDPSAVSLEASR